MATPCVVIEVRYNPINKQTQLQLVTQLGSQGREPVPDHPGEAWAVHPAVWPPLPKRYLGLEAHPPPWSQTIPVP